MKINLSLRNRLVIWYSLMVGISLATFGAYIYLSLSNNLMQNADRSLNEMSNSIDQIISSKANSTDTTDIKKKKAIIDTSTVMSGSSSDSTKELIEELNFSDERVLSVIYDDIIMNAVNYYIQISDPNNEIIWRSTNLDEHQLPLTATKAQIASIDKDSLKYVNTNMRRNAELLLCADIKGEPGDSVITEGFIKGNDIRIMVKRTQNAVISVGYSTEVIEKQTGFIVNILLVTIPIILIISGLGGFFLATVSMKPINDIIKTVNDIRVTNLSRRLPNIQVDDEIGRLTKTLNEMIARLENSFTQIRQFTSDASHELKTPLTIMRGELEIALIKQLSKQEYMRIIASSLDEVIRLTNVVENLLELSRADAGNVKLNFQEKSLTRLMVDIIEDAYILAEQNNIIVSSSVDPDVVFEYDAVKLHQAILNIIDNAIKYTPKYGKIFIELKKRSNYAHIVIADTGIGIAKDALDHIFDRFFRIDKSRSSEIKGSGLGLSIVFWIIKAHNGEINVNSEVNQGTEFVIKLPLNRINPGEPYIPYGDDDSNYYGSPY